MKSLALSLILLGLSACSWAETASEGNAPAATGAPALAATISREAARPTSKGPSERFTGNVRVAPLFSANAPSHASGASVTFEPGARTAWHSHPVGQNLVVTAGKGYVQFWGGSIQEIGPGDVVWIPPGQKHWHGASQKSAMTHIAVQEHVDGKTAEWFEQVSAAQYGGAGAQKAEPVAAMPSTRAQQLMGDIAPKLAELTDKVLYNDVWARPELSRRDRSLATVSALIALNRTEQLRSHLALARQNGVTQEELIETITHLAFYTGWPNAVSAVAVAREVFQGNRSVGDSK